MPGRPDRGGAPPALSVVLATYGRAETLGRTLDHLAKQDLDPGRFEVIVIDDGSPDHTTRVVEEAIPSVPFELVHLRHDNRGPGYTQNRGIRRARASIVLIMADDIWLAPGALRAHLAAHARHPEAEVAVLGKVVQSPRLCDSVFMRHWDPFGMTDLVGTEELHYSYFWANNITVKRDFLLRHGMFLEEVGPAGPHHHHDSELGHRLHRHGLRILFDEHAWGHHYHPYSLDQAIDRWYQRGLNWQHYTAAVPDPEIQVHSHVLEWRRLADYARVLRTSKFLRGRERSLAWHLLRKLIRIVGFNRLSVPRLWKPLAERAETSPRLAALMNRRLYNLILFYYFGQGIRDGRRRQHD